MRPFAEPKNNPYREHVSRTPSAWGTTPPPWWSQTTVYQVYPRSFADSDGDGIGDLKGIVGRLDYLHSLGVETLWLSPIYDSPQADVGYDIRDHYGVAPEYGDMDDVRALIDAVHSRKMRIVFDMVLNHTSAEHPWFVASRSSRDDPHRDWYIWRDGRRPRGGAPPNNWRAMIGGSGWHHDPATDQWYWSSFLPFQPDLNYRNPAVKKAMLDVVRFWLGQGVDGLRLDLFNALYKDASFANNPRSWRPVPSEENPDGFFQRNLHTIDHPDTLAFARELRTVVDGFEAPPRFLVGEVFGRPHALRNYCRTGPEDDGGLHLVFLFKGMSTRFTAPAMRALIEEVEDAFAAPLHPTWVFGNHDRPRSIHRLGGDVRKARLLAMLQLTARGVPVIYYGEEIGMPQSDIPLRDAQDPIAGRFRWVPQWMARRLRRRGILLNRDECRPPMAWTPDAHAGFTAAHATPWLPAHPRSDAVNVARQHADDGSMLALYRRLLGLRRERPSLHRGRLDLLDAVGRSDRVLTYRRTCERTAPTEVTHVALNFSGRRQPLPDALHAGRRLSTVHGWLEDAAGATALEPYEGVISVSG